MHRKINLTKTAYVCGPLTELPVQDQAQVKEFYKKIGDVCEVMLGIRAFVPHEHFDPIANPNPTPADVDRAERSQVCERTSVLIVVAIAPSWGGGIEVEMAFRSGVPIVILCDRQKLEQRKISRLLRGNPGVEEILSCDSEEHALELLRASLSEATQASAA